MPTLMRMDPLALDPGAVRVAVGVPAQIQPDPRRQNLKLSITRSDGLRRDLVLHLRPTSDSPPTSEAENRFHVFGLDSRAIDVARNLQDELRRAKAAGVRGHVTWKVDGAACATTPLPAGPVRFDLFLRAREGGEWIYALANADARAMLDPGEKLEDYISTCGSAAEPR
ncbi:hypothetical protein ABEG18_16375 [Alsobacter sp. KACC 23698]|uniref:DUF1795 domain-containing protein n=1 Tax=Alsobacter sp. KACC 23698 TaxID=3149229 RepID=A0AAU7JB61_9HYPH